MKFKEEVKSCGLECKASWVVVSAFHEEELIFWRVTDKFSVYSFSWCVQWFTSLTIKWYKNK